MQAPLLIEKAALFDGARLHPPGLAVLVEAGRVRRLAPAAF